jgi:23S rRNA (adenine2030-N6)-methyltransferase
MSGVARVADNAWVAMNYRHAFHAGNFADVLKHAVLCRILIHLRNKATAFRVVDTHGGSGRYDLFGVEASRSGEWRDGIGRLRAARLTGEAASLLAPYLDTVAALNPGATLTHYPGSVALAQAWLRPQDRLVASELEPAAAAALERMLAGDRRCKMLRLDGWTALRAQVPPKERRGVIVIDPPFEQPEEFARLQEGIATVSRKWSSGIALVWYPIKDRRGPDALAKGLHRLGIAKLLRCELTVGSLRAAGAAGRERLNACGLIVVNPPWTLEHELSVLLPALVECLSPGRHGRFRLDRLAREN